MNPAIITIFMDNLDKKTLELQKSVVEKRNLNKFPQYFLNATGSTHAQAMDWAWNFFRDKHDTLMFLDVDCIPLQEESMEYYFNVASKGILVGNAQRSNHIENGQHVFAAPHCVAMTQETYDRLGRPSASVTARGDVAEEYTFRARECGVEVELLMPLSFDRPPIRMPWETDTTPHWNLADGMPVYGVGTTYGRPSKGDEESVPLTWHSFQIFHPGQQEKFWERCERELQSKL